MKDLFGNEVPDPAELVELSHELASRKLRGRRAMWKSMRRRAWRARNHRDYVDADDWDLDELELGGRGRRRAST